MKNNCDGKCTNCDETELPNIKDNDCESIGYSYSYKTDCAGDRYIKVDEVRYLLKCERNNAIDDFIHECDKNCGFYSGENKNLTREDLLKIAEQLKAGGTE